MPKYYIHIISIIMGCSESTEIKAAAPQSPVKTYQPIEPYWCPTCYYIYKNSSLYYMHVPHCWALVSHHNGVQDLQDSIRSNIKHFRNFELSKFHIKMKEQQIIRYDPDKDKLPLNCCPYEIRDNGKIRECLKNCYLEEKYCKQHARIVEDETKPPPYQPSIDISSVKEPSAPKEEIADVIKEPDDEIIGVFSY